MDRQSGGGTVSPVTRDWGTMTHSIKGKLLATYVVIALFTGALGLYAIVTMEQLNEGQRTMYGDVFGGTHLLATWLDRSWESRSSLLPYLLADDPTERDQLRQQMAQIDNDLVGLAVEMDQADIDREDVQTLAGLTSAWQTYEAWRHQAVIGAVEAGDRPAAMRAYQTEGAQLTQNLDRAIDAFVAKKGDVARTLESNSELSYQHTRDIAIGLSVAAAGVGLLIGLLLARSIATSVGQVARAAKGLAVGDLEQRIQVRATDEIGEMAQAFGEMISYQQEMARVANSIAQGDLTQDVEPKGPSDVLGTAFRRMTSNLRTLVGQLEQAVRHANELLAQNAELNDRVRAAALKTTLLNEQSLRRISADLHDGPGQALALAMMRLDELQFFFDDDVASVSTPANHTAAKPMGELGTTDTGDFTVVRRAVQDALNDIRSISTGLRLPELTPLTVCEVVERAVSAHERRGGAPVTMRLDRLPMGAPLAIKIALFRALQEALSNATRHGGGAAVAVHAWADQTRLHLSVSDKGPGFDPEHAARKGRLGLASMRERAELLGGSFQAESAPGHGARLELALPLRNRPTGADDLEAQYAGEDDGIAIGAARPGDNGRLVALAALD
jgi:signal transduction histidine kinase